MALLKADDSWVVRIVTQPGLESDQPTAPREPHLAAELVSETEDERPLARVFG
jgi:hypothetical protein